jgi:hypothetical protein
VPSFWKEPRRAIDKVSKKRQAARDDKRDRDKVRQRDGYRCRLCGRRTSTVHEDKRRGAGGKVSLTNSLLLCDVHDGGLCHPLTGMRWIEPVMANGAEEFDANEDLVFEMTESTARRAFDNRPRPAHVRILEDHG